MSKILPLMDIVPATFRAQAATAIVSAFLSNPVCFATYQKAFAAQENGNKLFDEAIAKDAVGVADALIEALSVEEVEDAE